MDEECHTPNRCLLRNLDTVIASTTNHAPLTERQQRAAERITEDEGLTSSLTDDQARPIIEWACYQAALLAADPARSDEEVETLVTAIRRAILVVDSTATAEHAPGHLLELVQKELEQCL
jgi:hypothetical protein